MVSRAKKAQNKYELRVNALEKRKHNSHSHMSYAANDHRLWGHLNKFVRNLRDLLVLLKIFIKNCVKVRHPQDVLEKKVTHSERRYYTSEVKRYLPCRARITGNDSRWEPGTDEKMNECVGEEGWGEFEVYTFFFSVFRLIGGLKVN